MALDTLNICKAGDMDQPTSWTYYDIACLIEDMASLSHAEKSAVRVFVKNYAREVASQDRTEATPGMFEAMAEMAEYMRDFAHRMQEVMRDAGSDR